MSYSQFKTLSSVKEAFGIVTQEGVRFLPELEPLEPSAKKADLKVGLGQCAAEMVAAQRFNQAKQQAISTNYGCVSNGTQWRFMQLQEKCLTIDLSDYPLPPVGQILAFLAWMAEY